MFGVRSAGPWLGEPFGPSVVPKPLFEPLVPKGAARREPGTPAREVKLKAQLETPMIARSALLQLFPSRWDREFESAFLQR